MRAPKLLLSCVLAFSTLGIACGGSDEDALVEKSVVIMEDLAKAVEGAGEDCEKMATSMEAVLKKHDGDITKLKEVKAKLKGDDAAKEKFKKSVEKYKSRMEAAAPKLVGAKKCDSDPKMMDLTKKLRELR